MISLGLLLARAGGWTRMLLITLSTALTSGLLMVAVAMALLPAQPREALFGVVADPGTRGGAAFGTVLLVVPPLLLLYQAVRLGTAVRDRRLAALRLAGATPREVRVLGALEVGLPALVGSLGGLVVYAVLRALLGGDRYGVYGGPEPIGLVPTSVTPAWWQLALVVVGVAVLGSIVGVRASGHVLVSPLGVSRRARTTPPRPWGALCFLVSAAAVPTAMSSNHTVGTAAAIAAVALCVFGMLALAPWAAYRTAVVVRPRTRSAAVMLGAARLAADPRTAGRAAAAVGGVALVSGGTGVFAADILTGGNLEFFYVFSLVLVGILLLAALMVTTGTLAVHSVETLMDNKRSLAALRAVGTPMTVIEESQRSQAMLAAAPMAVLGVLLGSLALGWTVVSAWGLLIILANIALTLALTALAVSIACRVTRRWVHRAARPENLRTT